MTMPLKKVVWGRTWYVSTNAMLYYISHYYTRLLRFVIKDILEMPPSTLNKYAKKKVTQNSLLENGKDGNANDFLLPLYSATSIGSEIFPRRV